MMAHSGARGSPAQMRQLAGMRGLMAKPSGEIIESPIISNFKEGLSVLEYFNSTHGARKGLADTALKTANSGYLTRRLVDVAQDCIITERGLRHHERHQGARHHRRRHRGGLARQPHPRPHHGGRRQGSGHRQGRGQARHAARPSRRSRAIANAGVQELQASARCSPARSQNGVCGACYGRDLARGTPVNMGEAVGVIAAQSIGEPGTQLTMRTFHIGGAAQISEQSFIESNFDGKITVQEQEHRRATRTATLVAMVRNMVVAVVDPDGTERAHHRIPYGARMRVEDGEKIKRGQRIAEWDPYTRPILTEVEGTVAFEDLVDGLSMSEQLDESTGIAKRVVIDWRTGSVAQPAGPASGDRDQVEDGKMLKLARGGDARYLLAVDAILSVDPGAT